jgi:photosystem II stability/assembly factor-like uncharacterized protein
MSRSFQLILFVLATFGFAFAQWEMQDSSTTANLRGIHSVDGKDGKVAWASGSDGAILRTENGGAHWQHCAIPPGAEKLDFRAIWAWDSCTAMVMSAGPGDQSRLYKTTDACAHWTEEGKNSEKEGFWDGFAFQTQDFCFVRDDQTGVLIGDPVRGYFYTEFADRGQSWSIDDSSCSARPDESAFAASNSSAFVFGSRRYIIGTGGKGGPRALLSPLLAYRDPAKNCLAVSVPMAGGIDSAGIFSIAFRDPDHGLAVGGDYKQPDVTSGTAAWTSDGGRHWTGATKPPHGYRSSVAWYGRAGPASAKAWIAAGTNGSDVSYDDGKTWQLLDDGNWNAISLPYVVGPHGRIAKLNPGALKH